MKAASISEIQKELKTFDNKKLLELCIRLAKYKKENKELLSYLIFEAQNEKEYIESVKIQIDTLFSEINKSNYYLIKKSLRKILRLSNKYLKYSGLKTTEIELRIYYCQKIRDSDIDVEKSIMISNLYNREVEKIKNLHSKLHEDFQFDYEQDIEAL